MQLSYVQEAVRSRPAYADAYTGMGISLKELKRREEAEACFQQVVRLRPGCALSLGNLAGAPSCLGHRIACINNTPEYKKQLTAHLALATWRGRMAIPHMASAILIEGSGSACRSVWPVT